jgi:hypothetical protein
MRKKIKNFVISQFFLTHLPESFCLEEEKMLSFWSSFIQERGLNSLQTFPLVLIATTPITYAIHKLFPIPLPHSQSLVTSQPQKSRSMFGTVCSVVRFSAATVISGFILSLPTGMKKCEVGTLIVGVMSFLAAAKTTQLLVLPVEEKKMTTSSPIMNGLMGYGNWLIEFLYPSLPVSVMNERPPLSALIRSAMGLSVFVGIKYLLCPILHHHMLRISTQEMSTTSYVFLSVIWSISVLTGFWFNDLCHAWVPVLSFGRLSFLSFNNFPMLSSSLSDFWGARYNLLISNYLRKLIYTPLRVRGFAPPFSIFSTFVVSGLLHAYVAYFAFEAEDRLFRSFIFFSLHGAAVVGEKYLPRVFPSLAPLLQHPIFQRIFFVGFFCLTFRFYPSLFIESMPQWLIINPTHTLPPALASFFGISQSSIA